jgi:hypothetical protein
VAPPLVPGLVQVDLPVLAGQPRLKTRPVKDMLCSFMLTRS